MTSITDETPATPATPAPPSANVRLLLSAVTSEFGSYRGELKGALARPSLEAKVQADFIATGGDLLLKLDDYVKACDGVIHLVGGRRGSASDPHGSIAPAPSITALIARYPDLATRHPTLTAGLDPAAPVFSYTQWEAYLALVHGKPLLIATPTAAAQPDTPGPAPTNELAAQAAHLERLKTGYNRYPEITFDDAKTLAVEVYRSSLLETLYTTGKLVRPKVDISRLPTTYATRLFGRETEMADLNRAWDSGAPTPRSGPEVRSGHASIKTNIVVLDAMGGTGKTALVNHFVNGLAAQGWRGAEAVYVWSFYSQGTDERRQASADDFFKHALAFFGYTGEAPSSQHDKGVKLAELIAAKRALVILDGLEPLQYGPSRRSGGTGDAGLTGGLRDQGILALVRQVARENAGLLVVTTRLKVPDFKGFAAPAVIAEPLLPIPTPDGVEMIRSAGVTGKHDELTALVKDLRGHAIALVQVATWLVTYRDGDVRCRDEVPSLVDLGGDNERDPFRVMMAYEIQFKRQIADQTARGQTPADIAAAKQLGLLFLMGLFDRPMERGDREALVKAPAIPGITEALAGLTPGQLDYAVQSLRDLGLLLPKDPASPDDLDAHPLVREYFGLRLEKENPDAFKAAHGRLYDEYRYRGLPTEFRESIAYAALAIVAGFKQNRTANKRALEAGRDPGGDIPQILKDASPDERRRAARMMDHREFEPALAAFLPETAEAMAPLFTAIAHGCAAGRHDDAFLEVYNPRVARGNEKFAVKKLGLYGSDLGAVAQFFATPFAEPAAGLPPANQALVLNLAGFALRALGRLAEAVEPMRIGAALQASQEDWTNAASGHSNLAGLLQTLGRLRDGPAGGAAGSVEEGAVTTAARSVTYADESRDDFEAMVNRTTHADALLAAGDWAAARTRFQEAERRQRDSQPALPLLYSLGGYQWCDLTLAHGRAREVTARATYALPMGQQNKWALDIGLDTLSLGRAAHLAALDAGEGPPTGASRTRQRWPHRR